MQAQQVLEKLVGLPTENDAVQKARFNLIGRLRPYDKRSREAARFGTRGFLDEWADKDVDTFILACQRIRAAFDERPALRGILAQCEKFIDHELDDQGRWQIKARNEAGEILVDGIDAVIAGTPARRCDLCPNEFIPPRRDARFCSSTCRNTAASRRHRAKPGR